MREVREVRRRGRSKIDVQAPQTARVAVVFCFFFLKLSLCFDKCHENVQMKPGKMPCTKTSFSLGKFKCNSLTSCALPYKFEIVFQNGIDHGYYMMN